MLNRRSSYRRSQSANKIGNKHRQKPKKSVYNGRSFSLSNQMITRFQRVSMSYQKAQLTRTEMSFSDIPVIERRIIGDILDAMARKTTMHDFKVKIYGEGQLDYEGEADVDKMKKVIGDTDMTSINIHSGALQGHILLVHGNHEDVISDYGGNCDIAMHMIEEMLPENV